MSRQLDELMKVKLNMKENNIQVLILAAGQGKRMGAGDLPKVLVPLKGKPMLGHLLEAIKNSEVCDKPTIVIGKGAEKVQETFGENYKYVLQEEQLGTGHAVKVARDALKDATDVMVLYGDHPLVSAKLIKNIVSNHLIYKNVLTMATVTPPDFNGWRSEFKSFSRLVRDDNGVIVKDVQARDASPEQLKIRELNPCFFCFKADWLWENLEKVNNNNAQQEYYLTDLVKIAIRQGHEITTVDIDDPKEALGINSSEQLKSIEELF